MIAEAGSRIMVHLIRGVFLVTQCAYWPFKFEQLVLMEAFTRSVMRWNLAQFDVTNSFLLSAAGDEGRTP